MPQPNTCEVNKQIVAEYLSVYESHTYERIHELFASEYADHSPAQARNPEDVIRTLRSVERAFPDLSVRILDLFAEGDRVAMRAWFSGTHSADYMNTPASCRHVEWEGLEIFRIADHRIAESWGSWPEASMLKQMK
ncbi:MAG TPA: ester cyclase [Polyangiaceae bacterium]|nr:ester cyclase [Polyangiaceae bacterium]